MALRILEQVLALEKEAESMVERVHAEAREIEKEVAEKIAAMRREAESKAEIRISEYRAKAEAELKKSLEEAEAAHKRQLDLIAAIPVSKIRELADRVVASLGEGA
ncbi:MAG TPA: hypothetical protein PLO53_01820 [Candidatus Hydrogenedentes bacterium]|nr:hypothetical protein [Candidatus Hydrogenedentota bacterium]